MAEENEEEKKEAKAITPNSSKPPETEEENPDDRIRWGRALVSIVVILAAAGIMAVLYRDRNLSNEVAETPPPQVENEQPETPPSETPPPPGGQSSPPPNVPPAGNPPPAPSPPANEPPPAVTPRGQISGATTTRPEWVLKENKPLGFQYATLNNWREKIENGRVTVYDPLTGKIMATIEVFAQQNAALNSVLKQLESSSEVQNIQVISKNGQTFLHYNIQNSKGFGYATVSKNTIYYITDYSAGSKITEGFKTI